MYLRTLRTCTAPAQAVERQQVSAAGPPPEPGYVPDEDVAEEEERMRALLQHRTGKAGELAAEEASGAARRNAVEVFGLKKVYAGECREG